MNPALLELLGARAASGGGYVFQDTFTREDGPLRGTTADTGQTWVGTDNKAVISGGKAQTKSTGDNYAAVSGVPSDHIITATLDFQGGMPSLIIRGNGLDTITNFICLSIMGAGVKLFHKDAGPLNPLATWSGTVSEGVHQIVASCQGPQITVTLDGAQVISHSTTTLQTSTGIGIYSWDTSNTSSWDNIIVEAL